MDDKKTDKKEVKEALVDINRERYGASRTASGGKSLSNGDEVAKALEGLPLTALFEVADKLFEGNEFRARYSKLNTGMQRMNLGNRIRGFISKRDSDNEKAAKTVGGKAKLAGIDAVTKAVAPYRKEADKALADAKADKEAKAKATAEKKAAAEAKKKKAEHNKKASA